MKLPTLPSEIPRRTQLTKASRSLTEAMMFAVLASPFISESGLAQQTANGANGGGGLGQIGQAVCENGIGQALSVILAAIGLYLVLKGAFAILLAADDMGSTKPQVRQEGFDKAKGGGITMFVGIFGPAIIATFLQILGVKTVTCFNFNTGILGMIPPTSFVGLF